MRVFVAGGAGVVGRRLVAQLLARGHQVTATTTNRDRLALLARLGADPVTMDGLDAAAVTAAVVAARPDAVVHQMTGISPAHGGRADLRHMDRWFAVTNRLRTTGTDHLLAAARAADVSTFVAQSYASWNGIREGGWVKTEEDPLDPMTGTVAAPVMAAVAHLERVVRDAGGAALRYGSLYGPGATDDQVALSGAVGSPWSAPEQVTARGCTSTTPRARRCSPSSSRRAACSTSSTTNRPRRARGCPTSRPARAADLRCAYRPGWPGVWPATWR